MNNQPPQNQSTPSTWNTVLALLKRYWWIYPLWWIIKIAGFVLFGAWIAG